MKKIGFIMFMISPILSYACDNCNIFLNINPNDYQHSIGIQYRSRLHYGNFDNSGLLMLKHGGGDAMEFYNSEVTELYNRVELTGRYFINNKWNIQGVLPYVSNQQIVNGYGKYSVNGLGDPMVIQNYQVFNSKNLSDSIIFTHRLTVGSGVKLPLGQIDKTYAVGTPNLDLQPGTGSWDGIFTLTYLAKIKQVGIILNGNYKLNGRNVNSFQYGNTTNALASLFYQLKIKEIVVMPSIGIYAEIAGYDKSNKESDLESGGELYFADAGLSLFVKKFRFQANYEHNYASLLNNANQLATKHKMNFSVTYNI
jgi:hypothetical protein